MTELPTRQRAVAKALVAATEAMHAKGEVTPMIVAHAADGRLMMFDMSPAMSSPTFKDVAARMAGRAMRDRDVRVYVFMSEAWWASAVPPDDPLHDLAPSERADRVEGLVLSASDLEGDTVVTYRTVRNNRGRFRRFEIMESTDLPGATWEGRFMGLLRSPTVH